MLVPSTITVRRPSGESDFILTRVDQSTKPGHPYPAKTPAAGKTDRGDEMEASQVPFRRPKANSASCIIDGIKTSHFLGALGAYVTRSDDYFLSPSSVRLFGSPSRPPARKSSWQSALKVDLGKIKKQTMSYVKGSMDSLLSRLSGSEASKSRISEFLYVPNGLTLEILPQDGGSAGTGVRQARKSRNSKTSQSPGRRSCSQFSKGRNYSIPAEGPSDVSYETLQQHLSRLDNIIARHRKGSLEAHSTYKNPCFGQVQPRADRLDQPADRRVSDSNIQLPDDFSKNCPDRSFDCPLQGVNIFDGRFRASLPLSSFPIGHVCLKVRGYRLEIAHLVGNSETMEERRSMNQANDPIGFDASRVPSIICDGYQAEGMKNFSTAGRNAHPDGYVVHSLFQSRKSSQLEIHQLTKPERQRKSATCVEARIGYRYLGSVSIPIFVEPSTLEFSIDADMRWLKIQGVMKGCISSSCLNLEDNDAKE